MLNLRDTWPSHIAISVLLVKNTFDPLVHFNIFFPPFIIKNMINSVYKFKIQNERYQTKDLRALSYGP